VIDCSEWKTEKRHECTDMGKKKDLHYYGKYTSRHYLSRTHEILGRLIFDEQCVQAGCSMYSATSSTRYT